METNPAGPPREDGRRQGISGRMTTFTHTPGSIIATTTVAGRAEMKEMSGEGGTTPITAGAEITMLMVHRQKRGEGR